MSIWATRGVNGAKEADGRDDPDEIEAEAEADERGEDPDVAMAAQDRGPTPIQADGLVGSRYDRIEYDQALERVIASQ